MSALAPAVMSTEAPPNTEPCDAAEENEIRGKCPSIDEVRSIKAGTGPAKGEARNLVLLGLIFSLYFGFRTGTIVVLPLASKELLQDTLNGAVHSPLYQLPLAIWFVADICYAAPNAYVMRAYGRRSAFAWGGCCAFLASIGAFCVLRFCGRSLTAFVLLNVCTVVMAQVGMAEFVRFAAAEACADETKRSRSVAKVTAFGACMSAVAPLSASLCETISRESQEDDLFGFAYFFLFLAGFSLIYILAASMLRLPSLPASANDPAEPLAQILRRSPVWMAILAQATVQFVMVALMSGVPLAMTEHIASMKPADVRISGCIILHVFAMFIPGFWTGDLIARLGEVLGLGVGLAVQALSMVVCLTGTHILQFYAGLFLTGLGWNLSFVAGTMMVMKSHSPSERTKVTSSNEALRFAATAASVVASSSFRWDHLMWICLLALLPAASVVYAKRRGESVAK
mmetsp:Transcript_20210/g.50838  ORF Transcript_20210/g.50838 Transcript_20210/m.50838 type:complete len:456 (-) Transcript_20210:323-1690(-)